MSGQETIIDDALYRRGETAQLERRQAMETQTRDTEEDLRYRTGYSMPTTQDDVRQGKVR
jgi:hypothetical protein